MSYRNAPIKALPMDLVRLSDGEEALVNSAHYLDTSGRQQFSVCGKPVPDDGGPLYYADECELMHRHDYKPYGPIRRCDCGAVYTTMADVMAKPSGRVH